MYYSSPHAILVTVFRETIEEQGLIHFKSAAGMSLDSFLELLRVYLQATVVSHQNHEYIHKTGVCISSRVDPILSKLFLAACGS